MIKLNFLLFYIFIFLRKNKKVTFYENYQIVLTFYIFIFLRKNKKVTFYENYQIVLTF